MDRFHPRRLSPATMISCVALFVSLSGVGYAAATIGSSQIKNNAVQGKDIKNSSVTGKDIKTGSVSGSDLKNNGVTGTDVQESSLGQVPSAASATSATTAANATALGGAAPSAYLQTSDIRFGTFDTSATEATLIPARGSGLVSVTRVGIGYYDLTFDRDVSNCTWQATGGRTTVGTPAYIATVRPTSPVTANKFAVIVFSDAGAQVDGAAVFASALCPS